jgi:hypothetical protein
MEFTGIVIFAPVRSALYCAGRGCQPGRVRLTIRYCATPAGRIAYSTSGAGPALLCDTGWVTHLRGQLGMGSLASFVEGLAGFSRFRRVAQTPFNIVYEARP